MTENSMPGSLAERLVAKQAEDEALLTSYRQTMQQHAQPELESFGAELSAFARAEATTTRSAIAGGLSARDWARARRWGWPVLTGVPVVLGLALGPGAWQRL